MGEWSIPELCLLGLAIRSGLFLWFLQGLSSFLAALSFTCLSSEIHSFLKGSESCFALETPVGAARLFFQVYLSPAFRQSSLHKGGGSGLSLAEPGEKFAPGSPGAGRLPTTASSCLFTCPTPHGPLCLFGIVFSKPCIVFV